MLTLLAMFRAFSKKEADDLRNRAAGENEEDSEALSKVNRSYNWFNKYVMLPDRPYMILWNLIALNTNLITLLIVSYEEGFCRELRDETLAQYLFMMEIVICIDILVTFFKAYPTSEKASGFWIELLKSLKIIKEKGKKFSDHFNLES